MFELQNAEAQVMAKRRRASSLMLRLKSQASLTPAAEVEARMAKDLAPRDRKKMQSLALVVKSALQRVVMLFLVVT